MEHQLRYIDRLLDKVQELTKELQLVPRTTPKSNRIMKNKILSRKQLWVGQQTGEIDQVPMIWVSSVIDINHTSPQNISSKPKWTKLEISQEPPSNDYQASVANQGYEETKEACDQIWADALLCSQLQNEEQGNTLEQSVNEIIRNREQRTLHKRGVYSSHSNLGYYDDSTLTPNGSNGISGDSHGSSLYCCWVCGIESFLS